MATLTFLMGAPGSGKSTWAASADAVVLTSDVLRDGLYGAVSVGAFYNRMLADALRTLMERRDVVIDTPGDKPWSRERFMTAATSVGASTRLVVFKSSVDVCIERQRGRSAPVPDHVVRRIHAEIERQAPTVSREGWDAVEYVG